MSDLTIVSGLFRSGTSMMIQILQASKIIPIFDFLNCDEHNEMGYYEIDENQEERHLAKMQQDREYCVKVLSPLLEKSRFLPHATRVIFIKRNIDEVIDSTNKKTGYKPYKRKLLNIDRDARVLVEKQKIPLYAVNYNDILSSPIQGLANIRFLLNDFEKSCSISDKRLYKIHKNKV